MTVTLTAYASLVERIAAGEPAAITQSQFELILSSVGKTPEQFATDVDHMGLAQTDAVIREITGEAVVKLAGMQATAAMNVLG
jgi:hypothetical protein